MKKLISSIIARAGAAVAVSGKAIGAAGAFLVSVVSWLLRAVRALEDFGQSVANWVKGLTGMRLLRAGVVVVTVLFSSAFFLLDVPARIEQVKAFCHLPWSGTCVDDVIAEGDAYFALARNAEHDGRYKEAVALYEIMIKGKNPLAAARLVRLYKQELGTGANEALAIQYSRWSREWGLDDYAAQQPGRAAFEQANLARFGFATEGGDDAAQLYQRAADAGFGEAFTELAALEADPDRQRDLLEAAAKSGSAPGRYALAQLVSYDKDFNPLPGGEARATELIGLAAAQGLAEAQLAYAYRVKDTDPAAAALYFSLRFADGNADAGYELAMMNLNGQGVHQDEQAAIRIAQQAAGMGSADASVFIGDRFWGGLGLPKDPSLAFAAYSAAISERPRAEFMVAVLLYNGEGVEKDIVGAIEHFRDAADWGYAGAATWMGHFYQYGIEVQQDHAQAMEWYQTGAENGEAESARRLAGYLRYDTYSVKDTARAFELLEDAVRGGSDSARLDLASTLLEGDLDVVDVERALGLIGDVSPSTGYANYLLASIYFNRDQVRDPVRALQHAREGYRLDNGCAAWMLAWAYLDGRLGGTDATANEMLAALEFAAEEKVWCALNTLGNLYELGAYVVQDKAKALELYLLAAEAGYDKGAVNAVRLADELGQLNSQTWSQYESLLVHFAGDESVIATCMLIEKTWDSTVQPDRLTAAEQTGLYGPVVGVDTVAEGNEVFEARSFDGSEIARVNQPLLDVTPSPEWSDALLSWEAAQ